MLNLNVLSDSVMSPVNLLIRKRVLIDCLRVLLYPVSSGIEGVSYDSHV